MNVKRNSFIRHSGTKGSKWGYSKGSKNGKRTAKTNDEMADDVIKGKYGNGDTIKMELMDIITGEYRKGGTLSEY